MAQFNYDKIEDFLGIVRKYMQVRGGLSQKDLAELTEIGVSTMSRFLNRKTTELNPQLIAKIVAKLEIHLHEIIDFVAEAYSDKFVRLVKFYKEDSAMIDINELTADPDGDDDPILESLGTSAKSAKAKVSAGGGKTRTIPFEPDNGSKNSNLSLKEKLENLTPRQKAYMTDFLSLDMEGRDLVVDLGNNLFRYFRQKGMDF